MGYDANTGMWLPDIPGYNPNTTTTTSNQLSVFGTPLPSNNNSAVSVTPTGTSINTGSSVTAPILDTGTDTNIPAGYVKGPDGKPIVAQAWGDMTGLQKISTGVSMAAALANIWSGVQQNRLARQNFNFQKGIMETNLANQISSYNTALEDRVAGRYSQREAAANQSEINDYLDRNRAVNRMA